MRSFLFWRCAHISAMLGTRYSVSSPPLACVRTDLSASPTDAEGWRVALESLTLGFPNGEPWQLFAPLDRPAFFSRSSARWTLSSPLATPDELDILVTAKNHDVKVARLARAQPDDWLFALVTLQTTEGFPRRAAITASRG